MQTVEDKLQFYGYESTIPPGKTIREIMEEIARQDGVRFVAQFTGSFLIFVAAEHETLEAAQNAIGDYVDAGFRTDWSTLVQPGRVMAPKRGSPDYCALVRTQVKGNADPEDVLGAIDDVFEARAQADPDQVHFGYGSGIVTGRGYDLLVDLGHDTLAGLTSLIRELKHAEGVGKTDTSISFLPGNAIRPGKPAS